MKITKAQLKRLIKEELAEMAGTDEIVTVQLTRSQIDYIKGLLSHKELSYFDDPELDHEHAEVSGIGAEITAIRSALEGER
jgi:hypothetical protein